MGRIARRHTAEVLILIVAVHLALPVDVLIADDLSARFDACDVALPSGTILEHKQSGGTCLAHLIEYLLQGIAAGEDQQQDGDIGLGGIFHKLCCLILISFL